MKPNKAVIDYLATPRPFLVNGEWITSDENLIENSIDPATEKVIGSFYAAAIQDVNKAITAAHSSFQQKNWRGKTPSEMAKHLWTIADLIDEHGDTLAYLETLDGGKPFAAARYGEVSMAAESFRYYAGWCSKIGGRTTDISIPGDFHSYTKKEPIGVVGLITPWNGPLVMAAWKIAPALAAGCSLVIKPSELTSLSTLYLGKLISEAGIPDGVVNIVPGDGETVGATIVNSPMVKKVSFTGSTETGKKLIQASAGNLKKLTLELGGKSPVLVFDDADLGKAIPGIADGIFSNAGQVCVAGSRLYAAPEIYDDLLSGLIDYANNLRVGSGLDPKTQMGPLISAQHRNKVLRYISDGIDQGAKVEAGGNKIDGDGFFIEPTILSDVAPSNCVAQEEIFGPVLSIIKIENMDEAIVQANASNYGLAGSVWTQDISKAHKIASEINAGIFWINCHGIPDMAVPFGGYNQSGWGREGGPEGLDYYLETKSVIAAL